MSSFDEHQEGGGAQVRGLAVGLLFVGNKNQNGGTGVEQKLHGGKTGEWQPVLSKSVLLTHAHTHKHTLIPKQNPLTVGGRTHSLHFSVATYIW